LPQAPAEELTDDYYLTLIVRLLVDSQGSVLRGELTDAEARTVRRFSGEDGLYEALRFYLASNLQRPESGDQSL
jgi:hypothetical protein